MQIRQSNGGNSVSLEKAFKVACEKHEHLKLLESQWTFDKELISKALQNIGSTFPHYSRHDASHSKQIIINIERMLGDRIQYLSATDMWLLLEAAYNHDIGMVVTHKQIQDLNTPDFKSFVDEICDNPEHDLHEFAKNWNKGKITLSVDATTHDLFNEYRQLIAEWYRKKHPENAAKIVNDPFAEIGLTSPRNELLPKRLFRALASICNAHGQSFEKVLALPFSEAGMATEDCHPRYVAFLLRMGDLLDVDDNRFCPVMMRVSGESLPAESHAHFEKHRAIKHFRLDTERIKIEVECSSPESYEVAHDWFKWLEKEYHSQSQHWPKIVPAETLGRLPTLAPPKVTLAHPYVIINEGERPSFDLNREAVLKLLRSTGLYASKWDSIREILQNSVDSTIAAIWSKYKEEIDELNPAAKVIHEIYDKYMIDVDLEKNENDPSVYTLRVKDSGVGISEEDLAFILKIGSSQKSAKARLIRSMPEWFKPSGNFGIGLQSIYLLSDAFTIYTKSRKTHQALKLSFSSGKGSSVVIERLAAEKIDYGATLTVDIKFEEFPKAITFTFGQEQKILDQQMNEYDFTEQGSDLRVYERSQVDSAIGKFNNGSPVKIRSLHQHRSADRDIVFFSKKTSISLCQVLFHGYDSSDLITRFRGQEFSGLTLGTGLVSAVVDFHGHPAMNFLAFNREKILPEAKSSARREIVQTLLEYIDDQFSQFDKKKKINAAAFYFSNSEMNSEKYLLEFMNFPIDLSSEIKTLSEVVDLIDAGTIKNMWSGDTYNAESTEVPTDLVRVFGNGRSTAMKFIQYWATKRGNYWQEQNWVTPFKGVRHWSKEDIQPVSDDIFRLVMSGKGNFSNVGNRIMFPSWGEYRKLSIVATIPWLRVHSHAAYESDFLVLPYKFDVDGNRHLSMNDSFIAWVFEHRKRKDITFAEISELYLQLNLHIENLIKQGNAENEDDGAAP